ncbi:MAG: hypothetical protein ACRDRN_05595 [Sciscionella sp.]
MRLVRGRNHGGELMRFGDALEALGRDGMMGRTYGEVPIAQIVGTVARPCDFDAEFRLLNPQLRDRWQQVAGVMANGVEPPVELVQLGELYFVVDGHHRVSVARALRRETVTAQVVRICTVAYAMCCLRLAHLPSKAAERRFLERIPLAVNVRADLWLDEPADWGRLAEAAEAWAFRQALGGRRLTDREELAGVWWSEEVMPVLDRLRAAGTHMGLRDVELYTAALALRDRYGWLAWPCDLSDQLERTA